MEGQRVSWTAVRSATKTWGTAAASSETWTGATAATKTWGSPSAAVKTWSGSTVAVTPPPWAVYWSAESSDGGTDFRLAIGETRAIRISENRPLVLREWQPEGQP